MAITTEELQKLFLFEKLSPDQLDWLLAHVEEHNFGAGDKITQEGNPGDGIWILVEGEWQLTRMVGGTPMLMVATAYVGSWLAGMPLLNGIYQSSSHATKPSHLIFINEADLTYMLDNGFPIARHLLAGVSVGTRNFEATLRQHEKMAALGKLSAGLAHELNNPAAAIRRAADQLQETMNSMQAEALKLNQHLSSEQLKALSELHQQAVERAATPNTLSSVARSEREDELSDWLSDQDVENPWDIAPTLVEANLDIDWLEQLVEQVGSEAVNDVVNWLNCSMLAVDLVKRVENSSNRISTLVKSVKEYSYMDQAPLQEIDIHDGLESTLTMLDHKLKHGITVKREYDRTLPRITAYGSELNQVWTNLIDNAVDAMHGQGIITISTRREGDNTVLIEIADNGPGVPPNIQSRIFEPFFTTKGVGEGSGLGLDIAYRIVVNRHHGSLRLQSEPGDTRFLVRLPMMKVLSA